jgi:hypothetical protein
MLVTPYCKRIRPGRRTTRRPQFPLTVSPLVFRLAPTHLGWDTQRQFTRRSRDPRGRNADNCYVKYVPSNFLEWYTC